MSCEPVGGMLMQSHRMSTELSCLWEERCDHVAHIGVDSSRAPSHSTGTATVAVSSSAR